MNQKFMMRKLKTSMSLSINSCIFLIFCVLLISSQKHAPFVHKSMRQRPADLRIFAESFENAGQAMSYRGL